MNREMSPRIRSFLSALAAIGVTLLLASTLVESVKPVLMLSNGAQSAPVHASAYNVGGSPAGARFV